MFTKDCGMLTTHASRGNDKHERERRDIRAFTRSVQVSDFDRHTDIFIWDVVDEAGQGIVPNGIEDAIESAISTFYSNILLQLNFIKRQTPLFKV